MHAGVGHEHVCVRAHADGPCAASALRAVQRAGLLQRQVPPVERLWPTADPTRSAWYSSVSTPLVLTWYSGVSTCVPPSLSSFAHGCAWPRSNAVLCRNELYDVAKRVRTRGSQPQRVALPQSAALPQSVALPRSRCAPLRAVTRGCDCRSELGRRNACVWFCKYCTDGR